ncbi:hypothetical protein [Nocardioides rubriscoriae]|uniref:hypothetical protein n=1 Tax=Nocardioides rubriscoriae TaxID=642762 RepID=UPI0011E023BB|nr:hypothetical protein [Nocardioides rubriscoriae]
MSQHASPKPPRRRRRVAVLTAVGVVAAAGGAYAYWTAGGTGSGTVTTGTNTAVTVNQSTVITNLAPGVAAQTLSGTFDNPNSGPVYVGSVTITGLTVSKAGGAAAGTCDATDYTVGGTAVVNAEVPAGTAQGAWSGLTIAFNNKAGSNQDQCKGATVAIAYAAS